MYFPAQPPIGGQIDPAGMEQARPQFGWGGWAGWGGIPRPENIQVDPNQPVPQPGRPNQPNNTGTMPGAASPSTKMTAADQIAAWNEANPGVHKQRWQDIRRPGRRQQAAQQATDRQPPTTNRPPIQNQMGAGTGPYGQPPASTNRPPIQTTRPPMTNMIGPGAAVGPSMAPPVMSSSTQQPPAISPSGGPLPPTTQVKPGTGPMGPPQNQIGPGYGQGKPNAGMQLSAMKPWGQEQQL